MTKTMRTSPRTWIILAALAISTACTHKKTEAEQLGNLEKAYQGGAVTKQEYDAKKASITGSAAAAATAPAASAPVPASPPADTPAAPSSSASASNPAAPPDATATQPAETEPEPAPVKGCEDALAASGKDSGPQTRFYPTPVADVKKAALDAFSTLDFTVHSQDGNEIDASKKRSKKNAIVGAGGERVTLQFAETTQDGKHGTMVTGATKRGGVVKQKSWTSAVLAQIGCNLK